MTTTATPPEPDPTNSTHANGSNGRRYPEVPFPLPGHPDGRVGKVSIVRRGNRVIARYRNGGPQPLRDPIGSVDDPNIVLLALQRASEINDTLEHNGFVPTSFREAFDDMLRVKEVGPDVRASSLRKYESEKKVVLEYAEKTPDGKRCRFIHQIDTDWVLDLSQHLGNLFTTRNGGPVTPTNPRRHLGPKTMRELKLRCKAVVDHAMTRSPRMVPQGFTNPFTSELLGKPRGKRRLNEFSDPPVSIDDLAKIVSVADAYDLALLALLFLYGVRPSEIGHILDTDFDRSEMLLTVQSHERAGYRTKEDTTKHLPVTECAHACIRAFLAHPPGPIFIKRRRHLNGGDRV